MYLLLYLRLDKKTLINLPKEEEDLLPTKDAEGPKAFENEK